MIQQNQFWFTLAGLCLTTMAHNALSQSAANVNWEVQKLAYEVPTAVFNKGFIGGLAPVTMSDIRVIDTQSSKPRTLTSGTMPAWSPDGENLAFCSRVGMNIGQIQVINADGTGKKQLTNVKGSACFPDWSPDGTKIAFTAFDGNNSDIYVVDNNGENLTHICPGYSARWSPDGGMFVFMRGTRGGYSERTIWVSTADGKQTKIALTGDGFTQDPNWLPNGKGIVFSALMNGRQSVFRSNFDGTGLKKIDGDDQGGQFSWSEPIVSPDGKQLVADLKCLVGCFSDWQNGIQTPIVIVDMDTHRQKVLANGVHPSVIWKRTAPVSSPPPQP
jgi:Tol biopolymer transport system component